jgi:hypothetical protein
MKTCPKCLETKSETEFTAEAGYVRKWCNACYRKMIDKILPLYLILYLICWFWFFKPEQFGKYIIKPFFTTSITEADVKDPYVGDMTDPYADAKEHALKEIVLNNLEEPALAKIGEYTAVGKKFACITVNASNSFGGYIGDQEAVVTRIDDLWIYIGLKDISHESCIIQYNNR